MPSRRLLIVNPNTDIRVTRWLEAEARRVAGSRVTIEAINAPSGLAALSTPQDVAQAARAVVNAVKTRPDFDCVLIGAFGDPGLTELRQLERSRPIIGLGEAGLRAVAAEGRSFAIVTLGASMEAPLRARVAEIGYAHLLVDVAVLPASIAQFVSFRASYTDILVQTIREKVEQSRIKAVLLGGAPFAGLAASLQSQFDKPLIDGVVAAIEALGPQLRGLSSTVAKLAKFETLETQAFSDKEAAAHAQKQSAA